MSRNLTEKQRYALRAIRDWHGIHVKLSEAKALEKRGLVKIRRTDRPGDSVRGYWRAELTADGAEYCECIAPREKAKEQSRKD